MTKLHSIKHRSIIHALCATYLLICSAQVHPATDAGVCSTASIINPNSMDGGMGGTGNSGGAGGTGIVANGGTGGTGISGGNGGTGAVADGGAGGTGIFAENALLPDNGKGGIAILGVVTGFASICVNDTEVHYDASTPVFENGLASKLSDLTAGQMVMLTADRAGERLVARSIGMIDAVVGPIDKIDFKLMQVEVMGQIIQVDEATMQQLRALEQGAVVRVSGHRLANGRVVATRVGVTNKKDLASTYGIVTNVSSDSFAVNGTRVTTNNKNVLDKIKVGNEIQVGGAWNGSAIKPNRIVAQPVKNVMNRAETAIVEGFVGLQGLSGILLAGTDVLIPQVKTSYRSITNSTGKVVKMEVHRDVAGNWVCDKVEEREGALFIRNNQPKHKGGSNRGRGSSHNEYEEDSSGLSSDSDGSASGSSGSGSSGSGSSGSSGSGSSGSGISGSGRSGSSGSGSSGSGSSGSGSGISGSGTSGSGSRISVPSTSGSGSSGSGSSGSGSSGLGSGSSGSSGSGKKK